MTENLVIQTLLNRRSIRRFKSKEVSRADMESIVNAGQRAPTGTMFQAYSFINISDPGIKEDIEQIILKHASKREGRWWQVMETAPLWILICGDFARQEKIFKILNLDIEIGPVTKLIRGLIDANLAAENMVIAAESLGLGSCFLGYPSRVAGELVELLGLPELVFPFLLLCIGYPDEDPPMRSRLPINAVLYENGYQAPSEELLKSYYENSYGSLNKARGSWGFNFPLEATRLREEKLQKDIRSMGLLNE